MINLEGDASACSKQPPCLAFHTNLQLLVRLQYEYRRTTRTSTPDSGRIDIRPWIFPFYDLLCTTARSRWLLDTEPTHHRTDFVSSVVMVGLALTAWRHLHVKHFFFSISEWRGVPLQTALRYPLPFYFLHCRYLYC